MAYEKQTWVTGETITADKLNHMEDGIAAGGIQYDLELVYYVEYDDSTENYVLTGHGLSPENLLAKLNNGEIMIASLAVLPDEYTTPTTNVCLGASRDEFNNLSFSDFNGTPIVIRAVGTENCKFLINSSYIFTYTYNSSTKEYTFTYDGSAG